MDNVDKRKLIAIVKKDFPQIREVQLKWFDDGWDHVVVAINNQIAYRFPRSQAYAAKMPVEVTFTDMFSAESPVSIPCLKQRYDTETNLIFATYDYIRGVRLTRDLFVSFEGEEQVKIAKRLGTFLAALHSFSVAAAKEISIQHVESLTSWQTRLEKIQDIVFPHIHHHEQTWIIRLFHNFFIVLKQHPYQPVVTHSDIGPEHIIVDPQAHVLAGIIDFGGIAIGDPAFDFQLTRYYGNEFLQYVYAEYHLVRDDGFDTRRKFYEDRLPVTNLEHSLERGEPERIQKHKEQLSLYIKDLPL